MDAAFRVFLAWERVSRDTLDVKRIYFDIAEDVIAGLMLSEIIYWYLPSRDGQPNKLRIERDGEQWIAVSHAGWYERLRLSRKQADSGLSKLQALGLIEKTIYKFDGAPTIHIRLVVTAFLEKWNALIDNEVNNALPQSDGGANPFVQKGQIDLSEKGKSICPKRANPLTKTTTKTTTKIKDCEADASHESASALENPNPQNFKSLNDSPKQPKLPPIKSDNEPLIPYSNGKGEFAQAKARVVALFGWDDKRMTRNEHAHTARVVKELLSAGYTPDDIAKIYAFCKARYTDFSVGALTTNASRALSGRGSAQSDQIEIVSVDDDGGGFDYEAWLAS